jgi:hypothetical protein
LQNSAPISVLEYYKSFGGLRGAIAGAFTFLPVSSLVIPGRVFPPLGNETILSQWFAVIIGVVVTYLVFLRQNVTTSKIKSAMTFFLLIATVFFCAYLAARLNFVRTIDIPSLKDVAIVSVGYERTDFAKSVFGDASDLDMLRARGTDDEEIVKLWTTRSVYVSRITLLCSYLGCALSLIAIASLAVLLRARESPGAETPKG